VPFVVAIVTARGGSKGFPGKNLAPLGGRPLIAWTIEAARLSRGVSRVLLSTDDARIAEAGAACGAEVPHLRPTELAADDTPHHPVIEHMLHWLRDSERLEPDYVLVLQPTSPLRTAADIDAAIELAITTGAPAVMSVCEPHPHPYLAKRLAADGSLEDLLPGLTGQGRRQDFPQAFVPNGAIYLVRPAALRQHGSFCPPGTLPLVMPRDRSVDIDTADDLRLAEMLLSAAQSR